MTITIPPELDWVVKIAAGQSWPEGDEDRLSELGDVWYDSRNQLAAVNHDIAPMASGMRDALSGPAAEQFGAFVKQLNDTMPLLVETAGQLGSMSKETAVQTQYSKLMILLQLIWMAEQIIEWSSTIWGLAVVPEIEAVGRVVIQQIAKRFIMSVVSATAIQTGMDALVQAFQMFVLKDRTTWNTQNTAGAAEMGAMAGGVGGIFHEAGHFFAPDFTKSFVGRLTIAGATGVTVGGIANAAFGGEQDLGLAIASGIAGGMFAGRGGRGKEPPKDPPLDPSKLGELAALAGEAKELKFPEDGPPGGGFGGDDAPPPDEGGAGGRAGRTGLAGFETETVAPSTVPAVGHEGNGGAGGREQEKSSSAVEHEVPETVPAPVVGEVKTEAGAPVPAHETVTEVEQPPEAPVTTSLASHESPAPVSASLGSHESPVEQPREQPATSTTSDLATKAAAAQTQAQTARQAATTARQSAATALADKTAAQNVVDNAQAEVTAARQDVATQTALQERLTRLSQPDTVQNLAQNLKTYTNDPVSAATTDFERATGSLAQAHTELAEARQIQQSHLGLDDPRTIATDAARVDLAQTKVTVADRQVQVAGQVRDLVTADPTRTAAAPVPQSGKAVSEHGTDATSSATDPRVVTPPKAATRLGEQVTRLDDQTPAAKPPAEPQARTAERPPRRTGIMTFHDLQQEPDLSPNHGGDSDQRTPTGMRQKSAGSRTMVEPFRPSDEQHPSTETGHQDTPRPGTGFDGSGQRLGGRNHGSGTKSPEARAKAAETRASQPPTHQERPRTPAEQRLALAQADLSAARQNLSEKTAAERQASEKAASTTKAAQDARNRAQEAARRAAEPPPPPEPPKQAEPEPAPTEAKPREPRTHTPEEREQAWQDFLARAREQYPGREPVRETMTWTEATDFVDRQVEDRVREAQGAYWNPFDPQAAEDYVAYHAAQAHEHAWTMLMHDLGVDVPPEDARSIASSASDDGKPLPGRHEPPAIVLTSPAGEHTLLHEGGTHDTTRHDDTPSVVVTAPEGGSTLLHAGGAHDGLSAHGSPHTANHTTDHGLDNAGSQPHPETPAIVLTTPEGEHTLLQAVGGHEPPEVLRFTAPRDTVAHNQAVAAIPRAVGWKTLVAHSEAGEVFDGTGKIGGAALHTRLGVADGGFDGVVMVVCEAAANQDTGAAARLHTASGDALPVLAPTGEAMIGPDGDVLSGTWTVDDDLRTVPHAVGDWVVWKDGRATSLGTPSLKEALTKLGVDSVSGGPAPEQPVGFFHSLAPQQRATLGRLRYDVRDEDLAAASSPDSFYQALIGTAGPSIRRLTGAAPTVDALRAAVVDAVTRDLARPDSRYAHLVTGGRTARQVVDLVRDPLAWSHQEDLLVPHVAADVFGLDLGVVGSLGIAEAVGDPTGPRRGDGHGDPHVLVNVGDRYIPAHPDTTPPAEGSPPPRPRELQPRRAPGTANPWTAPLTRAEQERANQASDSVQLPRSVRDAAATLRQQTIQNHLLGHAAPSRDQAVRVNTLTGQVRDVLTHGDRQSSADTLDELDRMDRLRTAYTDANDTITRRVTELRTGFRDTSPPGPDVDRRAGDAAQIMADAEHAKAINQLRNSARTPGHPDGGLSTQLEKIRRDAQTRAQDAARQAGEDLLANITPPDDTHGISDTDHERFQQEQYEAILARPHVEARAHQEAYDHAIDQAMRDPALVRHLNDLAGTEDRHRRAEANRDMAERAAELGDTARTDHEQAYLVPLRREARAVTEWHIRQDNALADIRAAEAQHHLPPGFGERPRGGGPAEFPMGRRGQFVRLGAIRTSDTEGLADLAVAAAGTDLPAALHGDLHAAVVDFIGEHGSHDFMQRLLEGGLDFTVGTGGDRRTVHLELDPGEMDLAHQASSTAVQESPLGRKAHHAVEADHESTSGGGRSVGSERSLGVTADVTTAFGGVPPGLPNRVFSAKVGLGISAGSSRSHSFGEAAVSATKRLFEISGEVTYFDIPGAALAALVHRPGEAPAGPAHRTPMNVRVSFPKELAPLKPPGAGGGAMSRHPLDLGRPRVGVDPARLDAEANPRGPLHRAASRVAEAQHHFFNQAESVSGLRALREQVRTSLGGADADRGFSDGVGFYLGESSVMRMFGDITGPGSTSPMFVSADGKHGMHLTVTAKLRNAVAVTQAEVGLKEESQRFVNFSEGTSEGGSASLTLPAVNLGHNFGDPAAPMGGNSNLSLSGSVSGKISSSRGTDANSGSGHISGLVYNGDSILYRTTFHVDVDVATNTGGAHPSVGRDVTVFLRVPLHESTRFEAMIRDQARTDRPPTGHATYPADRDFRPVDPTLSRADQDAENLERGRQRNPPLSMAAGRGTGFSAVSHLAGSEKVMPELVRLIQASDRNKAWSNNWDPMETAYLRTQLASRYTREGLINWGNALFQDGGVRMEIVRPAKEGVEVITVKVKARMEAPDGDARSALTPIRQGRNSSAKLEIMPSAFAGNGGSDTVGSGLSVSGQVSGTGGIHLDKPTRQVGGSISYGFSRDTSDKLNVGASGFMLEAILYNGPVRTFDYRVAYDLEVSTRHQTGLNGLDWAALTPKAVKNLLGMRAPQVTSNDPPMTHTVQDGRARFVIAEKLAPVNPIAEREVQRVGVPRRLDIRPDLTAPPRTALTRLGLERTDPGTARGGNGLQLPYRRIPGPPPVRVVKPPPVHDLLIGHTPLNADDQVMDVLGGAAVAGEVKRLLDQLGVPAETYRDTPWMLTSSETLASSQVRGPSEIRQTLTVGGAFSDKRVDIILTGFPHNVRTGTERIPIFQMHVAEGNGSVGSTSSRSTSHSVKGSLNLGLMDHSDDHADKTSGPSWSFSKNLGDKSSSSSRSLTPTAGRLTQGTRDYHENTADMLWRITVVKRREGMVVDGAPQAAHSLVDVPGGISFLRQADPVADPRGPGGALRFPTPPADTVPLLRAAPRNAANALTGHSDHGPGAHSIPTVRETPGSTRVLPKVPILPGPAVSERLMPAPHHPAPGDARPALEVTGEGNPVLDAVQRLLQEHAPGMLDDYWTVQEPRPDGGAGGPLGPAPDPIRRVGAKLSNLLNPGSLEALVDLMLGPGLILTGTRSLPLANERVQILLRATRDPNNRGYAFLEHIDSANVSRYTFRLNAQSESASKPHSHSASTAAGPLLKDAPKDDGRFANGSVGFGLTASSNKAEGHSLTQTDAARDTYFTAGEADRYAGEFGINVSVTKTIVPSRFADAAGMGLPRKIAGLVQGVGNRNLERPSIDVPMIERVLVPSALLHDDVLPPAVRNEAAVREVPAGTSPSTAGSGMTPFPITKDDLLRHDVVNFGFDHAKLRVMFDEAMKRFSGTVRPDSGAYKFSVGRLVDAGTRSQDAMHYLMSHPMFTRQLEFLLTDTGLTSPGLIREGGPFTDTSGDLTMKVELANPHIRGYSDGWLESVDYGFKEFNRNESRGSGQQFNINGGTGETSGDMTPHLPPNDHNHQSVGDSVSATFGRSVGNNGFAVLKTMPKAVAYNRKVPWLRVNADAIVHLTINARNSRDLINLPGGRVTIAFKISSAVELGLSPEQALAHGLVHPKGLTTPSGVFVAAHGAGRHGVADHTEADLRAAYTRPAADDQFVVHARVTDAGNFVVGNRVVTPDEFHRTVLAHRDLANRTIVLVAERGDRPPVGAAATPTGAPPETAAEGLVRASGRPVLATRGDLRVTQDGSVVAHDDPLPGGRAVDPGRAGTAAPWELIRPEGLGFARTPHSHVLDQALVDVGRDNAAKKEVPPPPPPLKKPDSSAQDSHRDAPPPPPKKPAASPHDSGDDSEDEAAVAVPKGPKGKGRVQDDSAEFAAKDAIQNANIGLRDAQRQLNRAREATRTGIGGSDQVRTLGAAEQRMGDAELEYAVAQSELDALPVSTTTSTLPSGPGIHIASGPTVSAPVLPPVVHEEPEAQRWFGVSPTALGGGSGYRFSDTGWFALADGTRLPPGGWQRSGDLFVQPSTGFAVDQEGHVEPATVGLVEAGDDGARYTVTGDLFGLFFEPDDGTGVADGTHIPLSTLAEPPS